MIIEVDSTSMIILKRALDAIAGEATLRKSLLTRLETARGQSSLAR